MPCTPHPTPVSLWLGPGSRTQDLSGRRACTLLFLAPGAPAPALPAHSHHNGGTAFAAQLPDAGIAAAPRAGHFARTRTVSRAVRHTCTTHATCARRAAACARALRAASALRAFAYHTAPTRCPPLPAAAAAFLRRISSTDAVPRFLLRRSSPRLRVWTRTARGTVVSTCLAVFTRLRLRARRCCHLLQHLHIFYAACAYHHASPAFAHTCTCTARTTHALATTRHNFGRLLHACLSARHLFELCLPLPHCLAFTLRALYCGSYTLHAWFVLRFENTASIAREKNNTKRLSAAFRRRAASSLRCLRFSRNTRAAHFSALLLPLAQQQQNIGRCQQSRPMPPAALQTYPRSLMCSTAAHCHAAPPHLRTVHAATALRRLHRTATQRASRSAIAAARNSDILDAS